jgi:hypothetical protein
VEGFGLLLAKGCDHIAALNPCKQKQPLKLWHTLIEQLFVLDQGCGHEASPNWFWRKFLAETWASKLKGKTAMINRCFDKNFYKCQTQMISCDC